VRAAERERPRELRPNGALPAFDLDDLGDDAAVARQLARDGGPLRLEAKAGSPLPIRRHAEIDDPAGGLSGHVLFPAPLPRSVALAANSRRRPTRSFVLVIIVRTPAAPLMRSPVP
jgi:hypothetical protein